MILEGADLSHKGRGESFKNEGFTFIEILIVIVIISIVATFAILSISINENKRLENITNQIINSLTLAEQEALLRPTTLSFVVTNDHYQFYEYQIPKNADDNPWIEFSSTALKRQTIPPDVRITVKLSEKNNDEDKSIIISPSGDLTPFTILIGKKNKTPRFKIVGEANGIIKKKDVNEEE